MNYRSELSQLKYLGEYLLIFFFIFTSGVYGKEQPVSLANLDVLEVEDYTKGQFISFSPLLFNKNSDAQADDVVISGKVTDGDGVPLLGVSVVVEESNIGTVTDFDGNYTLTVPENSTLVFSFVGMVTKLVEVDGRQIIDVVMIEDVSSLEEVVVVGYGTQKRSDITGAIGVIDTEQYEDQPIIQVGQALQGLVAGVQVSQNSGSPGGGMLIRVRGAGTVNNSDPLYVVDGNPNVDPVDLIPDQIESIQVLKSASASAIYGAQGANGVVLITTKKGKSGKSRLNINLSQGLQTIQKHLPVTNAAEFATLYNEGLVNAGDAPLYPDPSALGEGTDWQREMFSVAPMTTLTVSASGGSEKSNFFFSGNYTTQDGILPRSDFERVSLRVNSSHEISPAITLGQNLAVNFSNKENLEEFYFAGVLARTLTANPEIAPRNPDGSFGVSTTSLNSVNPLAYVSQTINDSRRYVANGNVFAELTFLKDIVFRSQYNFNLTFVENTVFVPTFFLAVGQENQNATLQEGNTRTNEYSWANTLTYNKDFGNHNLDVLAGVTVQESTRKFVQASGGGIPENSADDENLRFLNLATIPGQIFGDGGSNGLFSYLGRVNYDYDGRYFATGNFRADGSSRFGANNKWGYFPSFSLGWKLSEERFLENSDWADNLMLRAGWGSLGNQNALNNYGFASLITPNTNYTFGEPQEVLIGQAPTGQGNPDLKWETTRETNLGLDFKGFNNKVSAYIDWYRKETSDLILRIPLVAYSGIQNFPFVNGGSVLNTGIEVMLGYENTTPGGFTYSIVGNASRNRNEVLDLINDGTSIFQEISFVGNANVTRVGDPIASQWGWQTDGIFQTQQEVDNHAFQTSGTSPGDIRFVDVNEDGVVDSNDQTIIGNPWPKLTYGLNTAFSYKNFDARVQFQGVYGNDIFMGLRFRTEGSNFFNYTQRVYDGRWTGPGTSNTIPAPNTNDPNNNMRSSDYYLESGSYLRVRNIQLTYKIPTYVFNDAINMSIYGSVQNAFTFTKYPGFDPEIGTNGSNPLYVGFDEANYPVPRVFTLGLKVGF
ncbi:TonB-linked SusC/RagA family outer membrane protein [Flavobacteriaceae bacterium MAR_2009_75]|nr:TonB-linked SusC/RagA family outer membrane protein [Flavobacteriaceae bacterium MAR_2009_75]